ncbi:hypothetical protein PENTCL1PPCAC_25934 [Pristionchus entomophagus]|uniref:SXP/RAL-2 family protein Ani s 5-like cation-binding domain-containing protein n=1 Tax=Pristionchus entomophagus TaxID=358040 RepID=A0AAV5UBQ0_9BILA|nr:hypothetical protein PENTCL1PPCAC_25934 [Pristionchus entomophagus]
MQIILVLSAVALCVLAHFGGKGASPAPLSADQKAEIKAKVQAQLAALSTEAQTAGNQIITAFEANEGNQEATKAAVEHILSTVSDSVKQELVSILPGGRHFLPHHKPSTTSV